MDRLKLLGSAFLPSVPYSQGIATAGAAGAMVVCVAIVLNVGPFAKAPPIGLPVAFAGQAGRAVMQEESGPKLVAPAEVAARDPQVVAVREPQVFELAAEQKSVAEPVSVSLQPLPDPIEVAPSSAAPADRQNAERAAIVGVWAPDAGTCSVRDFRDGVLPTVITNEGAWAGEAFCIFTKRTDIDKGWRAVAKCSTPRESWTAHVRLKINDNRLIWTSERGTQAYSRCGPDVLLAAR
ncbi:MAG TPA: hypothetical protein VH249_16385 [Xanthobacteraceae bacterium]|jgi:hypothetical protein|nr:hypothetical protein [Xanthobacteraceae bacterium]